MTKNRGKNIKKFLGCSCFFKKIYCLKLKFGLTMFCLSPWVTLAKGDPRLGYKKGGYIVNEG